MIVCNFVALVSMIVQMFTLQRYRHFVALNEGMVAARMSFGLFALAYGSLGLMLALGLRFRYAPRSLGERRTGFRDVVAIFGAVFGYTLGNALSTNDATNIHVSVAGRCEIVATAPTPIFAFTFIGWLTGIVGGPLLPNIVRSMRGISDPLHATAGDTTR